MATTRRSSGCWSRTTAPGGSTRRRDGSATGRRRPSCSVVPPPSRRRVHRRTLPAKGVIRGQRHEPLDQGSTAGSCADEERAAQCAGACRDVPDAPAARETLRVEADTVVADPNRDRLPTVTSMSTRVACAWRATFDRSSRTTATTWCLHSPCTLPRSPLNRTVGERPRAARSPSITASRSDSRPPERSSGREVVDHAPDLDDGAIELVDNVSQVGMEAVIRRLRAQGVDRTSRWQRCVGSRCRGDRGRCGPDRRGARRPPRTYRPHPVRRSRGCGRWPGSLPCRPERACSPWPGRRGRHAAHATTSASGVAPASGTASSEGTHIVPFLSTARMENPDSC